MAASQWRCPFLQPHPSRSRTVRSGSATAMSMTARRTSADWGSAGSMAARTIPCRLGRLGSANFEFRGSYVLHWIIDNGGLSTPYDCAGLFGDPCGHAPALETQGTSDVEHAARDFPVAQLATHGGVKLAALDPKFNLTDTVSSANTKLGPQDYFDVAAVFVRKRGSSFAWESTISSIASRRSSSIIPRPAADRQRQYLS